MGRSLVTVKYADLWFDDGNLVIQAQTTKFCVHRTIMCRHSDYIRTAIKDGAFTETAPLTLMATSSTATTLLLKMIYDVRGAKSTNTPEEYLEMLQAALELRCADIVDIILEILSPQLPPEKKLAYGMRFSLERWKLPVFREWVLHFEPAIPRHKRSWPLENLTPWALAREGVARRRTLVLWQAMLRPDPARPDKAFCIHMSATILAVLPFCPRQRVLETYVSARTNVTDKCSSGPCCWNPTEKDLLSLLPSLAEEYAMIDQAWKSDGLDATPGATKSS